MKKILSVFLLCAVLLGTAVPAGAASYGSIPALSGYGVPLWLLNPNVERIRPSCGPGSQYKVFASMNGSTRLYKPREIRSLEGLLYTPGWVYVRFLYSDNKYRCGWFQQSLFGCNDWGMIEYSDLRPAASGFAARDGALPYNGPGYNYGEYTSCTLGYGDSVTVYFQAGGWYYCSFWNDHGNKYGTVFLWLPASDVYITNYYSR